MDEQLKTTLQTLTTGLESWLDQPSPTTAKIARLRKEVADLKDELGAAALGDMLKPLERANAEARRQRQREAADAIAEQCRGLGVMLEAREPPKRMRVAGGKGKKATKQPALAGVAPEGQKAEPVAASNLEPQGSPS